MNAIKEIVVLILTVLALVWLVYVGANVLVVVLDWLVRAFA